jgi:flagellar protein FliS
MSTVANAYLETQVLTASPERLHLLVTDAAIRFARQAVAALENDDIERAFHALNRSRSCVNDILTGITSDPNPELADRLRGLFVFVQQNLARADLMRDSQLIRDALTILETHRQTWMALIEKLQQTQPDRSTVGEFGESSKSWTM